MRSTSFRRRLSRVIALGIGVLLLSAGLSSCIVVKPIVLVWGDSLTAESADYITFLIGDGFDVRVDATGGTALCDYQERIIRSAQSLRPKLVIAAFSGNAATPCMGEWTSQEQIGLKFYADVNDVAERLSAVSVPLALVTPPPVLRDVTTTAAFDERVPSATRYETWAETGIDTERTGSSAHAPDSISLPADGNWRIGEIPTGLRSEIHPLDGVYRQAAREWRARGAAVGIIDGFTPFATAQGSWTKVQPCGPWEAANPLCRDGLIDVRSADLGHFCPSTTAYNGVVPKCSTYSPGALRWASQMAAYVRFIDGATTGHLDVVTGGPESVSLSGWAIDPSLDLSPTDVHIYVDTVGTAVTADVGRPDVGRAFPVAGATHGFSVTIPAAPGLRSVCAYAINLAGPGVNMLLGCRVVEVAPAPPFGFLDQVTGGNNQVAISGWAADPKAPTSPIDVSVQIGMSSPTVVHADLSRPDVASVFPSLGSSHGYARSIAAPPGQHTVCVTALNIGVGSDTPLGCRTVTVLAG